MNTKLWTIVGGVALACVIFSEMSASAAPRYYTPTRNRQLLNYAISMLGQKVGDGQCASLVNAGLIATGSKPGNFADPKNYDWGTWINPRKKKYRGDIIQFEDVVFKGSTPDGGWYESSSPHHTAIVKSVLGDGRYVILEQNSNGRLFVTETTINVKDMKSGRISFYRPEAP